MLVFCIEARLVSVKVKVWINARKWLLQRCLFFFGGVSFFSSLTQAQMYTQHYQKFWKDSLLYWSKSCVSEFQFLAGLAKTASWARKAPFWLSCGFLIHWHRLNCTQIATKKIEMIVFYIGDGVVSVKPDSWSILEKLACCREMLFFNSFSFLEFTDTDSIVQKTLSKFFKP